MALVQAYRFALDPTPGQARALASHCGAARFAFNWALGLVKQRLDQHASDPSDPGVPVPWTLAALRREWNQAKHEVAPWWQENSKEAYSSGLDALARALANFSASRAGRRAGRPVGFPRFKPKHRTRPSCRFTTGAIGVEPDRHHVVLPRLGRIRTHESTRKLARRIEQGTARILSATISQGAGRWYVSFTCQVQRAQRAPRRPGAVVGVDVGIRHLAVLSTGQQVPNPAPLAAALGTLRRCNRELARRRGPVAADGRRRVPSAGWRQTRTRLARAHARVANVRRDRLHKITSQLASEYGTVVVEDLNVVGMVGNRRLARHIADAGWAELRRQLGYKTMWAGGRLVLADRWFASSKTCCGCRAVKAKLPLATRVFHCGVCGLRIDRDLNAARNLARLATLVEHVEQVEHVEDVAGSGPETRTARGGDARPGLAGPSPPKREAGTGHSPGQTGTVASQGAAARSTTIADDR
jgi:IS605 OrfB family transposase